MEMDTLLKIWAVAGPLLAASASAVWARRVQLQDRTHEDQRAQATRMYTLEDGKTAHTRSLRTEVQTELRTAASDFLTALHEYVICASSAVRESPADGASAAFVEARKGLNRAYGRVALLGDESLSNAATEIVRATVALPNGTDKLDDEATSTFLVAKSKFISIARDAVKPLNEA